MAKVQVALPVYNGSTYLDMALASLEAQTHLDFEVVVYNNASTDNSGEIAERYAERLPHFRVVHRPQTVPLLDNFLGTFDGIDAAYLVWRAHDDYADPTFLEILSDALDANPHAALAAPTVITHKSKRTKTRRTPRVIAGRAMEPASMLIGSHASWIYGMFRPQDLERCYRAALDGLDGLWAVDHATMLPMILDRRVALAPGAVFHQQVLHDPLKWRMQQPDHAEQKAIFRKYLSYGNRLIDERGFNTAQRALLKAVLLHHVSRRTFHVHRLMLGALGWRRASASGAA